MPPTALSASKRNGTSRVQSVFGCPSSFVVPVETCICSLATRFATAEGYRHNTPRSAKTRTWRFQRQLLTPRRCACVVDLTPESI